LFATLRRDLAWSEYALSYDRVLNSTQVYPDLLKHILGEKQPTKGKACLSPMKPKARILDLGAGTGNASLMLAEQRRDHVVFALENNRTMLDMLRAKCSDYLRSDDDGPGILAIKQDVNTLHGLPVAKFDYAILNNVAYAIEDPVPCFRQVRKALKPGGEIRISGPQKKTDLSKLFERILNDISTADHSAELQDD
jgi:SAM-dependent methyltransferase